MCLNSLITRIRIGDKPRIFILLLLFLLNSLNSMSQTDFSGYIDRLFGSVNFEHNSVTQLIESLRKSKFFKEAENKNPVFSLSNIKRPKDSPIVQKIVFEFIADPVFGFTIKRGAIKIPFKNSTVGEIAREIEWFVSFEEKKIAESYFNELYKMFETASKKIELEQGDSKYMLKYAGFLSDSNSKNSIKDVSLLLQESDEAKNYIIRLFLFSNFSLENR